MFRFIIGWGVWLIVSLLLLYNLRLLFDLPAEYRESVIQFLGVVATLAVGGAAAMVAFLQKRTADRQSEIANRQADIADKQATAAEKEAEYAQFQLKIAQEQLHTEKEKIRLELAQRRYDLMMGLNHLSAIVRIVRCRDQEFENKMTDLISRSFVLFGPKINGQVDGIVSFVDKHFPLKSKNLEGPNLDSEESKQLGAMTKQCVKDMAAVIRFE